MESPSPPDDERGALMRATTDQCRRQLETQAEVFSGARRVLLEAALRGLEQLPGLSLPTSVKDAFCKEFAFIATACWPVCEVSAWECALPRAAEDSESAANPCRPVRLGDWRDSVDADSFGSRPADLPRATWFVARRMRGLHPVFFLSPQPPPLEPFSPRGTRQALRSVFPDGRSDAAAATHSRICRVLLIRSPATHAVSPHLAWLSGFVENGGLVVDGGHEDPDCGVLRRRARRDGVYVTKAGFARDAAW